MFKLPPQVAEKLISPASRPIGKLCGARERQSYRVSQFQLVVDWVSHQDQLDQSVSRIRRTQN